jgi:hypothetical protein
METKERMITKVNGKLICSKTKYEEKETEERIST